MPAKKLIEVALPLEAINAASAREKSIRHGHPSTLHLWWARRPLAAARAVIFASLVDDPDDPDAKPDFVAACKALNWGATNEERAALKKHNEKNRERREKGQPAIAFKGHIPTNVSAKGDSPRMRLFDFIERLVQWEATTDESIMRQARQLIQIATNGNPPPLLDPFAGGGSIPLEAQRLGLEAHASDLNPVAVMINKAMIEIPPRFADMPPVNPRDRAGMFTGPHPPAPAPPRSPASRGKFKFNPIKGEGENRVATKSGQVHPKMREGELRLDKLDKSDISPSPLVGEGFGVGGDSTWKGAAGLAADVRYYGEWMRERAYERIGHLYPKHRNETVIAWLWARTVTCPNPACRSTMPLMNSFELSKKKGKRAWLVPHPDPQARQVRFTVQRGEGKAPKSPKVGRGAKFNCLNCGETATVLYIKNESTKGRMGAQLTAIVTEGRGGRNYHSPTPQQVKIAESAIPEGIPLQAMNRDTTDLVSGRGYGFYYWSDLFTPRQLTALTTFSDLVGDARTQATQDALEAGFADDELPLRGGGRGARAYGEALSVYLAFAVDRAADNWTTVASWIPQNQQIGHAYTRQALPMRWDFPEGNPFSTSSGCWFGLLKPTLSAFMGLHAKDPAIATQADAQSMTIDNLAITPPPPPPPKINAFSRLAA